MILNQTHKPNFRRNLTLSVGFVLLAGFILSVVYLFISTQRHAQTETLKLGKGLAQQTSVLSRPLIISDDKVSLNYLLNELLQLDYVQGIQINDPQGFVIARAGETSTLKIQHSLKQQEKLIAQATFWFKADPVSGLLQSQQWPLAIIALVTILSSLLILWFNCRQLDSEPLATEFEASELTDTTSSKTPETTFSFQETLAMQTTQEPASTIAEGTKKGPSEEPTLPISDTVFQTNASHTPSVSNDVTADQVVTETARYMPADHKDLPKDTETGETDSHTTNDMLKTNDLVDLLKPEQDNTPVMPKFEHHPQDLEPQTEVETMVLEEQNISDSAATESHIPSRENPLIKSMAAREEIQLEMYTFEQELELLLAPQDAIYIFYIDSQTASSDNMHPDEKATLLNVYHHLAKQVARIYNGEAELQENKDILLRFELRDDHDSHGTNALCAAMLFSLLYKGFNQSRIRGFQPVLSLQMSLARGHYSKLELVKEEAHFLTRTTNSNELISHTALTESPVLKESMFKNAEIRREDEDKVLLLKVTAKHQALLQKQANHLLTKIFKK